MAGRAVGTMAASVTEPGDSNPLAHGKPRDPVSEPVHDPDDLVAGYQRKRRAGKLAVDDVQVGPANGTGLDSDTELAETRDRQRDFLQAERLSGLAQHHRSHLRPRMKVRVLPAARSARARRTDAGKRGYGDRGSSKRLPHHWRTRKSAGPPHSPFRAPADAGN